MATTSGNLMAGKVASRGGDAGNGRQGLRAKLVTRVAILGCAGALAFGGLRATGTTGTQPPVAPASAPGQACIAADGFGVPGEGCTDTGLGQRVIVPGWEQGDHAQVAPGFVTCIYADMWGVPGEGCAVHQGSGPTR